MGRDSDRGAASWEASHVPCCLPPHKPGPCPAGMAPSPLAWKGLCADRAASVQAPWSPLLDLDDQPLLPAAATETRVCARTRTGAGWTPCGG